MLKLFMEENSLKNIAGTQIMDQFNAMWEQFQGKTSPNSQPNPSKKKQSLKRKLSKDLQKYLIVASDASNIYLIEPGYKQVKIISQISIDSSTATLSNSASTKKFQELLLFY